MKKHRILFGTLATFFMFYSIHAQQWGGSITTAGGIFRQGTVEMNSGILGGTVNNAVFNIFAGYTEWDGGAISLYHINHANGGGMEFKNQDGSITFTCRDGLNWLEAMRVNRNRTVGIGTTVVPTGYLLAVRQGIITEKVRVELCSQTSWSDYVFGKEYPLLSLNQVNEFIEVNHHLPGMPASSEIETDGGFELKDMTIRQQEKIEELFLYAIELNNEITKLKKELAEFRQETVKDGRKVH